MTDCDLRIASVADRQALKRPPQPGILTME
jgi:hypothetical protein